MNEPVNTNDDLHADDITENKRIEKSNQEELKERQIILDSVPVLIFYKDKENLLHPG